MKKLLLTAVISSLVTILVIQVFARQNNEPGYILNRDSEIAVQQPGPHDGGGTTTAYPFFSKAKDFKLAFRKRTLHPGSSIGYHLQKEDEVYYILSGNGTMQMNGKTFPVKGGDAILTRPGSSHGLQATTDSVTLIIAYILQ